MLLNLAFISGAWALVQHTYQEKRYTDNTFSGMLQNRIMLSETFQTQSFQPFYTRYPCKRHPHMCKPPFSCHNATNSDMVFSAVGGHSNLRSFCSPIAEDYVDGWIKQCIVDHNMEQSAMDLLHLQEGRMVQMFDASFCFMEGHCTDTEVTDNTTVEEAETMCNQRFGHKAWARDYVAQNALPIATAIIKDMISHPFIPVIDFLSGFHEQEITRLFSEMACAMGTFHCDVQYCKHTYCKIPFYEQKFKHLLPRRASHDTVNTK